MQERNSRSRYEPAPHPAQKGSRARWVQRASIVLVLHLAVSTAYSAPAETQLPGGGSGRFGSAVALDGDRALVGASRANGGSLGGGRADVLELQGGSWTQVFAFNGVPSGSPSRAGQSAAIDGNTAIVGAPGHDQVGIVGRAIVLERSGGLWSETQQLVASAPVGEELFGQSVDIDGSRLLVGDIGDAGNRGAVYVFDKAGGIWSATQKLVAADRVALDNFGDSVALDGSRLVVGAPDADPLGNKSGAAYVFLRSGGVWLQEVKLVASNGSNGDTFGTAVDVSGDSVLVGAPGANAVYVFARLGGVWTETTILTATTPAGSSSFGSSIAIAKDPGVIAGALIGDPGEDNKGAAYVFEVGFTGWQQIQRIVASNGVNGAAFGSSVGVSADDDRAIVGAPFQNAAYIYDSLELPIEVSVDIQPEDSSNAIGGRRGIVIAILSETGFNPTKDVKKSSLRFGKLGTENSRHRCGRRFGRGDFNGDGVDDLLCSFKFSETGLSVGDTTGVLTGQLKTGRSLGGDDPVTVQ